MPHLVNEKKVLLCERLLFLSQFMCAVAELTSAKLQTLHSNWADALMHGAIDPSYGFKLSTWTSVNCANPTSNSTENTTLLICTWLTQHRKAITSCLLKRFRHHNSWPLASHEGVPTKRRLGDLRRGIPRGSGLEESVAPRFRRAERPAVQTSFEWLTASAAQHHVTPEFP